MNQQSTMYLAGISGVIASTLPLIMIFASTIVEKSFSWSKNALSDIGVSPTASLFNSTLIVGGLLNLLFVLGLRSFFGKNRLLKTGISIIIVSSVSLALVGVFTEDTIILHAVVALGYLLLAPLGLICIGAGIKNYFFGKVSFVLGIAALLVIIGLPLLAFGANLQIGFAVPEFLESLIFSSWIFWVSIKLLRLKSGN
jgi:hypothetical membrane protein